MTKVVIVGAGSQFGGKLSRDILSFPVFQTDMTITLCDIESAKRERVPSLTRSGSAACPTSPDRSDAMLSRRRNVGMMQRYPR